MKEKICLICGKDIAKKMYTSIRTYTTAENNLFFSFTGKKGEREKKYEKADHLGNVHVVISDKKLQVDDNGDGKVDYYRADVRSVQDYYPFGSILPSRSFNTTDYRWGFNGKEKIDEVYELSGSFYDYGERMYDSRIGRPPSVDPIAKEFPELSPYQFFSNNPIWYIDLDGLEGIPNSANRQNIGGTLIDVPNVNAQDATFTPASLDRFKGGEIFPKTGSRPGITLSGRQKAMVTGTSNIVFGTAGAVGSVAYMAETAGAGAALGGAAVLQLSLGQMAIGISQVTEALVSPQEPKLPQTGSLPGFMVEGIAKETGSETLQKTVPFVDVGTSLGTGITTKGLSGFLKESVTKPLPATERVFDVKSVYEGIEGLKKEE